MSTENLTQQETLLGGWSSYGTVTPEDKAIFDEATEGLVGVDYTPLQVATQVVAGTNFRFKCNASTPPSEAIWGAIVEIFKPLEGKAVITGIIRT